METAFFQPGLGDNNVKRMEALRGMLFHWLCWRKHGRLSQGGRGGLFQRRDHCWESRGREDPDLLEETLTSVKRVLKTGEDMQKG